MIRTASLPLLAASLVLAACAGPAPAAGTAAEETAVTQVHAPLTALPTGVRYRLAHSERSALQGPQAAQVTLTFDGERMHGDSSCNHYAAGYTIGADGRIRMQAIGATKRGCPDVRSDIERAWFDALSSLQWIRADGDALLLHLAAGDELRFVPAPPETE